MGPITQSFVPAILCGRNTLAYWIHSQVMKKMKRCEYNRWGMYYKLLQARNLDFVVSKCLFHCQSQAHQLGHTHTNLYEPFFQQTPQLTTESVLYESVMFYSTGQSLLITGVKSFAGQALGHVLATWHADFNTKFCHKILG